MERPVKYGTVSNPTASSTAHASLDIVMLRIHDIQDADWSDERLQRCRSRCLSGSQLVPVLCCPLPTPAVHLCRACRKHCTTLLHPVADFVVPPS